MRLVGRILHRRFERLSRAAEQRMGAAQGIKWLLRYVFPDHWSFLLGEIALYSFIVLVGTGVFLALYYTPGDSQVVYHGSYALLGGTEMSEAYRSVLDITFNVPAGLLFRQVHHWAADVFISAIVLHLMRIFFTGAYRKPRDLNWLIGLTMLMLAILEGFAGYSLVDDLLSGMGLAIAYGVAMSIPFIGGQLSTLIWGGPFPGSSSFLARLEIVHVLLIPAALAVLITVHLVMIMRAHHTQFPGPGRRERNVVGTPMWPAYALRSVGLMLSVAAVLFLLGGLIQINPIWQWGPYHPYLSENGAQPDWYIGWLIGALRLMPNFEPTIAGHTIIPNPFWGGAFFPLVVFGVMYSWPALERRITGDHRRHDLLDRPRDRPIRTAVGAAFLSWVVIVFAVGSTDRLFYRLDVSYTAQIHFWRVGIWILPIIVFFITRAACRALQSSEAHPLRDWQGTVVRRRPDGAVEVIAESPDREHEPASEPPVGTVPGHE
ncbi:MAG TPA: ubiquinol-cytochrome c reductase cytochrome b subunit [Solirubrobacteraceae bacterium]|jgi:ubiquinol-cytochrome c reductase cytochrome b subunit|nr:ubiquinol-cytochrome c reductase cytochrome b subunit [Solirubrobacteraceae bacterium]